MNPEPNDEFELQPSAHEPKPVERGPVPPKIKPDPDWATHQPIAPNHPHPAPAHGGGIRLGRSTPGHGHAVLGGANSRATPGRGVPNYANMPARLTPQFGTPHHDDGMGTPRRRTTGAQRLGEAELLPHHATTPHGVPQDGPPPSEKVDFENLPEFVWQRKMLHNVKLAAAGAGALLVAIVLYFALRAGTSTVKPIVDELEKKNDGAELLRDK